MLLLVSSLCQPPTTQSLRQSTVSKSKSDLSKLPDPSSTPSSHTWPSHRLLNMSGKREQSRSPDVDMSGDAIRPRTSDTHLSGDTLRNPSSGDDMSGDPTRPRTSDTNLSGDTMPHRSSGDDTTGDAMHPGAPDHDIGTPEIKHQHPPGELGFPDIPRGISLSELRALTNDYNFDERAEASNARRQGEASSSAQAQAEAETDEGNDADRDSSEGPSEDSDDDEQRLQRFVADAVKKAQEEGRDVEAARREAWFKWHLHNWVVPKQLHVHGSRVSGSPLGGRDQRLGPETLLGASKG